MGFDYMGPDYMHIKGHNRSHGTYRNLTVMAQSYMVLFGLVEIIKGKNLPLGLVYSHIHSLKLIVGQIYNTEHY